MLNESIAAIERIHFCVIVFICALISFGEFGKYVKTARHDGAPRRVNRVAFEPGGLLDEGYSLSAHGECRCRVAIRFVDVRAYDGKTHKRTFDGFARMRIVNVCAAQIGARGRDTRALRIDDLHDLLRVERIADADRPRSLRFIAPGGLDVAARFDPEIIAARFVREL